MLPLHFLVVPLVKMLGLSSLGSLLPPMETTSKETKRKLRASPPKATTKSTAFNVTNQKAD